MWPFNRTTRSEPEMGDCPSCGGRIGFAKQQCRNRRSIPVCTQCNLALDESYEPAWVHVRVQTERREQEASPAKRLLRASQLPSPEFIRTRYWKVYSIGNNVDVCYDSDCGKYDMVVDGEIDLKKQDVKGLIRWVENL